MTVLDWALLRSIRPSLDVEQADEVDLQKIEDAADEFGKLSGGDEIDEVRDLQTLVGVAQKVIKVKTMQAEAAIEELEVAVKGSGLAQENERLRREIARLKSDDLQDENLVKKLRDEIDDVQLMLKREKQNSVKFEGLYAEAERDRKSLQVEVLALQTELDEKTKESQKHDAYASNQMNEKQYLAKLKEKNEQITKLMLAVQEEESLNDELRNTIDQLGAKLRDATVELNQSADLIENLRYSNAAMSRQIEQGNRETRTLEGVVDEYMNRINELEALQPSETDQLSRTRRTSNSSSEGDRLDTWRGILESKNGEIHALQIRLVQLQHELDSVLSSTNMSTLTVLKKAIAEKDGQIKNLADSLSQATLDIEDNTRIIETLKGELASKGQSRSDGQYDRDRLRKAEDMNAELEKQLLDREEQLADALLVARKYEMGVYGLSDAVTEVRVCKRKIASRDKNIARLQEQLAESYVDVERLTRENEQLCQGVIPASKNIVQTQQQRQDSVEAEKTILALEEEILTLKQALRDLQRNVVDNVHKVSSNWTPPWDKSTVKSAHGSSDEENLDRCQISQASPKRQDTADTDLDGNSAVGETDPELENQRLKEFLIQILEALQKINSQKNNRKVSQARPPIKSNSNDERKAPPTPVKRRSMKEMPKEMRLLREFISDILDENQKLANDLEFVRSATNQTEQVPVKLFESTQQQVLRQRSLLSVFYGVLVEQLAYADCLQEVYRRQIRALQGDSAGTAIKISLSHKINYDYAAELKQQIRQLNSDIVAIKTTLHNEEVAATQAAIDDQTENLFMLEKLRMQTEMLNRQHLKSQKLLAEREAELMQLHERLRKAQTAPQPAQVTGQASEAEADSSVTAGPVSDDEDDDDTVQEESQTESERSVSQSFYRKMDSLREYNRRLCAELADAKYLLKRTQDALKIRNVMVREVNRQQAACGNLEQKMKVMEISLDTTKKLLGHKEQTLERYRQLVTELKQQLVSVKVKCHADVQQLERAHMNELYEAKKQIAELTMKTFHHQQLALDNDSVADQGSFERILAEKQVQIVQLQNRVKSLTAVEFQLTSEVDQANDTNQRLRESLMELQERLRAVERSKQQPTTTMSIQLEVPEIVTTPDPISEQTEEADKESGSLEKDVADLTAKLSAAENRVTRLKTALDDAKEKISAYEVEAEQQNAKIEQLRKIQKLRRTDPKRMKILEDDIDSLRRQLYEAKQQQQQRAEKPYDEAEKRMKQNIEVARWEEAKKWQMIVEGLKEQLKEKSTAIERLEATQALLRAQIVRLEKEKYKLQDKIKASAVVGSEHSQTIDSLLRKIQQLERTIALQQKAPKKTRPKENQIVPILVSPRSPRRHKERRKVSFDSSVIDNELSSEPDEPDESRLEDEPMPPDLGRL